MYPFTSAAGANKTQTPSMISFPTGWVRSSSNVVGDFFGVCTVPGAVLQEVNDGSLPGYTLQTGG